MSFGLMLTHSCKDMLDTDGNPLNGTKDPVEGIEGQRALYREITAADTIAEYHYNGLLLSEVIEGDGEVTKLSYSGDKITKIDYYAKTTPTDSVTYSRLFTYGINSRISTITETRQNWTLDITVPIDPPVIGSKTKTIFEFKYDYPTLPTKMSSILMKTGTEVAGSPFAYTDFSQSSYVYDIRQNLTKMEKYDGTIDPVSGALVRNGNYYKTEYFDYDNNFSPFTLLPWEYRVSATLDYEYINYKLSPNNPKKMVLDSDILPSPTTFTSNFVYDPQAYLKVGYFVNYIYKPQ